MDSLFGDSQSHSKEGVPVRKSITGFLELKFPCDGGPAQGCILYRMPKSSTSKIKSALGGITDPAPISP